MESRLDVARTYEAIIEAARARRFLSYADVARASGVEWRKAHLPIGQHLDKLLFTAHSRGWPLLTVLVVTKDGIATGELTGGARHGFLQGVQRLGIAVTDADADRYIREQQQRTFDWAKTAPDALDLAGPASVGTQPLDAPSHASEVDTSVNYWFAGSVWGDGDQFERFMQQGVWQNGYENDPRVDEIRPGDRIAIKASYVRKHDLPFDVGGQKVSAMKIKAVGTVLENLGNRTTLRVEWTRLAEPREWFFYTYRVTLVRADPGDPSARRLIEFAFFGAAQDCAFWLGLPYFKKKYFADDETSEIAEVPDDERDEDGDGISYGIDNIVQDGCFLERESIAGALKRLREKKNLVLQGPPGTGKTWLAKRLGYALLGTADTELVRQRMRVVQFHPTLSYEDFVRGWRPGGRSGLELVDGIFLEAVQTAQAEGGLFVFIIEEINRGNPAQIFGEMLTLLEDSKRRREEGLELAYRRPGDRNRFHIPEDFYVIGTMNLADRSLATLDVALRRRFAFVELSPAFGPSWRQWCKDVGGLSQEAAEAIEDAVRVLNERIGSAPSLGQQYRVGHSYFTPNKKIDDVSGWFDDMLETEVVPLLAEYWYDDPAQVESAIEELRKRRP